MGEKTRIAWTDHTFNSWWGCTKVGPGCDNCYAEAQAARYGHNIWGFGVPRRYFGNKHWDEPLKWNEQSRKAGKQTKVFCASMADVFDNEIDQLHRERLWGLIAGTPFLTWQILTKRIGNVMSMIHRAWQDRLPENVWIIATVCNQEEADRDIPKLVKIPARVRGLSIEPMLGRIDLWNHIWPNDGITFPVHWIIFGGESKQRGQVRECNIDWIRQGLYQCQTAGVKAFVKQLGSKPFEMPSWLKLNDRAGADPSEWPRDLRVQEWPA